MDRSATRALRSAAGQSTRGRFPSRRRTREFDAPVRDIGHVFRRQRHRRFPGWPRVRAAPDHVALDADACRAWPLEARLSLGHAVNGEAKRHDDRPEPNLIAIVKDRRLTDAATAQERAVLAAEILDRRRAVPEPDARVMPR